MSMIARPKAMTSRELEQAIMSVYGGGRTSTGVSVTHNNAMQAMSVHTCVKAKANGLRMMPCHLMRRNGEEIEKATDHYLYRILHDAPNSWMTPSDFWGMVSTCLDLRGNFYALKVGLPGRQVKELIPLAIDAVQEVIQDKDFGLVYKVARPQSAGGGYDTIPGNKIIHLRGLTLNGYLGINPIQYARESIGLELATEKHGAKLFSNGAQIGGVLQMPAGHFFKDRTVARKFLDDFNSNYASVENAHKAALLENGVTWQQMGMTSVDSQFLEARRFQHRQIVDLFFSLPLSIMTSEDKTATFSSSEQFSIAFVQYALMPYVTAIEQGIWRDLLTEEDKTRHYAKFEPKALLRGSFKDQMEAFQIGVNTEIYSPNDVREMLEMNPYPGGEVYRTRTSSIKEQPANEPKKTSAN